MEKSPVRAMHRRFFVRVYKFFEILFKGDNLGCISRETIV